MPLVTREYPAISRCGLKLHAIDATDYVRAEDVEPLLERYKRLSDYVSNNLTMGGEAI